MRVCELGLPALRIERLFRALLQDSASLLPITTPRLGGLAGRRRPDHPDREGRIRLSGGTKNAYSGRALLTIDFGPKIYNC